MRSAGLWISVLAVTLAAQVAMAGGPVVFLQPEKECYSAGEDVVVLLNLKDQSELIVGGEFFLRFDTAQLEFVSADPGDPDGSDPNNPFDVELFEFVDAPAGLIEYIVGTPFFGPESDGTADPATMIRFTFRARDAGLCGDIALVRFVPHQNPPNRITTQAGAKINSTLDDPINGQLTLIDLPRIIIDGDLPVISDPSGPDVVKVDEECLGTFEVHGTVTDDCCVEARDVKVDVVLVGNEFCDLCLSDADCGNPTPVCDMDRWACRPCLSDAECSDPNLPFCVFGSCAAEDNDNLNDNVGPSPNRSINSSISGDRDRNSRIVDSKRRTQDSGPAPAGVCEARIRSNCTLTQVDDNTVAYDCAIDVAKLLECPAIVEVRVNAVDCCGQQAIPKVKTIEVTDNTPPVITRNPNDVTTVNVDPETCCTEVLISGTLCDNCCLNTGVQGTISLQPVVLGGVASIGPIRKQIGVNPDGCVRWEATIPVCDVQACPVTVGVRVNGMDCCGNRAVEQIFTTDVYDKDPPEVFAFETVDGKVEEDPITGECSGTIEFFAVACDACCLDESRVKVAAILKDGCGDVQDPAFTLTEDGDCVYISGKVEVENITCCFSTVGVQILAMDCCGNAAPVAQETANIENNVPPSITCPTDITVRCFDEVPLPCNDLACFEAAGGVAEGGCDVGPEFMVFKLVDEEVVQPRCPAEIHRTYGVSSCDSPQATCVQRIIIDEDEPPIITATVSHSGKVDDECFDKLDIEADVRDNCCIDCENYRVALDCTNISEQFDQANDCTCTRLDDKSIHVSCNTLVFDLQDCPAECTVRIEAADCCQIPAEPFVTTVNFSDNIPPVVTCPEKCLAECDALHDTTVCGLPFVVENCGKYECQFFDDESGLIGCNNTGTIVRTWFCTDTCDNVSDRCEQLINIVDTTGPELFGCQDIFIKAEDDRCEATVVLQVTAEDSCQPGQPLVSYCAYLDGQNCTPIPPVFTFPVGTTRVKACAKDACGNETCCEFGVTVADNEEPDPKCPPDRKVPNDPGLCQATVNYVVDVNDNCPGATISCFPPSPLIIQMPQSGMESQTVCCEAEDASGNTDDCCFVVDANDTEPPVIDCPDDMTVPVPPDRCEVFVPFEVIATDNCTVDPGPVITCQDQDGNAVNPGGDVFEVGVTTVTCTACDLKGNCASCTFKITVTDPVPPVPVCPDALDLFADAGTCAAVVDYDDCLDLCPNPPCPPYATDNCFNDGDPYCIPCLPPPGSAFQAGGCTDVTCTASDGTNQARCSFDICVRPLSFLDIEMFVESSFLDVTDPCEAGCDRCITFTLKNCGTGDTYEFNEVVSFTPDPLPPNCEPPPFPAGHYGTTKVLIPCGDWTSISAKDQLHTLRRTVRLGIENNRFTADFTGADQLECGDLNDDNIVEVVDFGILLSCLARPLDPECQFNPSTTCDEVPPPDELPPPPPPFHMDFNCDGKVTADDFTCVQNNFPRPSDGQCCQVGDSVDKFCSPSPVISASRDIRARTSVSLATLAQEIGIGAAREADVDGNGVFDMRDVVRSAESQGMPVAEHLRSIAISQGSSTRSTNGGR